MLTIFPHSISNSNSNFGHQPQLAEKIPRSALPRAQLITGTRLEASYPKLSIQVQLSDPEPVLHHSTLPNRARATIQP